MISIILNCFSRSSDYGKKIAADQQVQSSGFHYSVKIFNFNDFEPQKRYLF